MPDFELHLEQLAALAHADGGWGYAPGQAVHLEPTCLALLALSLKSEKYRSQMDRALGVVRRAAAPDGAYRLSADRSEAIWPTALVLFLQSALHFAESERQRTAARLLAWQGRIDGSKQAEEIHDMDMCLTGWPWAENNFSWVEPTAWACLALRHTGFGDHARVREGLALLLDRAFDDGGVNYGNRTILGRRTEPIPGPTALMLLALQGHGHEPRVRAAVAYLIQQVSDSEDLEHLCWAKLALDCHRDQPGVTGLTHVLDERIVHAHRNRSETAWLRPAPVREALTVLALGSELANPFRLSDSTGLAVTSEPEALAKDHASLTLQARMSIGTLCGEVTHKPEAPAKVPDSLTLQASVSPRRSWSQRLASTFRGMAIDAVGRLRQLPPATQVHIAPATSYNDDLAGILQRQYQVFRQRVPLAGKRVVLKPNLVEYHRDKVINTNPHVVAAAIELCLREGAAEVIVAEGPGHWRNVEYLVQASGLGDVLRHYRVSFTDLNHDDPVKHPNLGRLTGLEYLYLSRTVACADVLISLPKLKTHHWAGATLSLKNLFGTLPGICYGWPKNELHWRGIDNSIVDIALTRPPDLAIVDGIVGMEGDGPLNGIAKPLGALIMGCDGVAVDATCCRLMGLDPERIRYLIMGWQKRLGLLASAQIEQIGESIDSLAQSFDTVPHFRELQMV